MIRLTVFTLLTLFVTPATATAQRQQVIDSLVPLYHALTGTYGDEGPYIQAQVETVARTIEAWERSLAAAEPQLRARLKEGDAKVAQDVHGLLASAYAERGRFADALREIDALLRLDSRQYLYHRLKALTLHAANRPAEAADAFRTLWLLASDDPQNNYRLIVNRSSQTSDADIDRALKMLGVIEHELVGGTRIPPRLPFLLVSSLRDAIAGEMTFAPAAYATGLSRLLDGDFNAGLAALREAAANDPLVRDPGLRLESAKRGIAALQQGQVAASIELLELAVTIAPGSSEAHRILGSAYGINGDTATSIQHLREAIRLNRGDERAWVALADTLDAARETADALQVLREATIAVPGSGVLRWMRADVALRHHGATEEDIEVVAMTERLVMLAGRAELLGRAADIAQKHLDYDRAIRLLEQRVALAPNDPAAHRDLGLAYADRGDERAAYAELIMALLLDPNDVAALTAVGRAHTAAGEYDRAIEALQRAVSQAPQYGGAVQALGEALTRSGRIDEGRDQLQDAARLLILSVDEQRRLRNAQLRIDEADIRMREGRYDEAIVLWQRAIELEDMNAAMYLDLGKALAAAKRYPEAATAIEKAIALNAAPDAHLRLAEVYTALGRVDDAARQRNAYTQRRLNPLGSRSLN